MGKLLTSIFIIVLLTSLSASVLADEETISEDEAPTVDTSYLDHLTSTNGEASIVFKLNADGTDSAYYGRYLDPYDGKSFYIDKFNIFGTYTDGSLYDLSIGRSWDSSWTASQDWKEYGNWHSWSAESSSEYIDFPSQNQIERDENNIGFESVGINKNAFGISYTHRKRSSSHFETDDILTQWKTRDFDAHYDFTAMKWESSARVKIRDLSSMTSDNNVRHTSISLAGDRKIGNSSFVRGNMTYTSSDPDTGASLNSLSASGLARFSDALGIDDLNLTTKLSANKNSDGPSKMHPAGGIANFNIGARYSPTKCLKLNGYWDTTFANKYRPDRLAIGEFVANPSIDEPLNGNIVDYTMETHRAKIGGRLKLRDDMDLSANLLLVKRHGMDYTDFNSSRSGYLSWDSEFHHDYTLRYQAENFITPRYSDWELKYQIKERSNKRRNVSDDDEHLTLNWSGMLDDHLTLHFGYGYLRTINEHFELREYSERGSEYYGGFHFNTDDNWSIFADYWNYQINGSSKLDQDIISAGLEYRPSEQWTISLEYEKDDGKFVALSDLDYTSELMLLRMKYQW